MTYKGRRIGTVYLSICPAACPPCDGVPAQTAKCPNATLIQNVFRYILGRYIKERSGADDYSYFGLIFKQWRELGMGDAFVSNFICLFNPSLYSIEIQKNLIPIIAEIYRKLQNKDIIKDSKLYFYMEDFVELDFEDRALVHEDDVDHLEPSLIVSEPLSRDDVKEWATEPDGRQGYDLVADLVEKGFV